MLFSNIYYVRHEKNGGGSDDGSVWGGGVDMMIIGN